MAARALVAGAGEPGDLGFQELLDRLEAERNQGLDEGDRRVEALYLGGLSQAAPSDVFHLALVRDAHYSLHGAAPCSVGWCGFWRNALNHTGAASSIFNYE